MAKIVRYSGNLVPFASSSLGTERTIFGEVTQADDITSQFTPDFLRGWGIVGPSDQPTLQDFNAVSYTHGQILAYLHQMGVAEYNAAQEYFAGSVTQDSGIVYISLANANTGNTPASSPASWKPLAAGQLIGTQKITTSGTYTPTPGMKTCRVRGVGGGGGSGGSAATAAGTYTVTGGGASGGYSEGWFTAAQIGASISASIGIAGAAGASGPNNGGNGGTTSLGALMVIPGGGGAVAVASTPNSSPALSIGGTPGAAPTGGSLVNMTGISGTFGVGTTTSGLTTSGVGGSTPLGAGGFSTTLSTPVSGTGYGAGGSGAVTPSSFAARAGAAGTAGVLIIEEFA